MDRRWAAASLVVLVAIIVTPVPWELKLLLALVPLVPVGLAVGLRIEPGLVLALALAGSLVSGHAGRIGLPISPDRPLFALALAAVICGAPVGGGLRPRVQWRSVHTWMIITVGVVIVLGTASDSFDIDIGRFALLDRLGIVPFLAFTIAPVVYATARQRSYLTAVLIGVGWYLGVTALLEGFGLKVLAVPSYIDDPFVGLHYDRARGPFAESTAMGIALLGCLVAAFVALRTWRGRWARLSASLLIPVLLLGVVFTLTRAVWVAAVAATAVGVLVDPRTRKFFLPLAAAGALAVALTLLAIPGLADSVTERRSEERAVWDRLNTNIAAVRVIEERPLDGIGWAVFAKNSDPYLLQHPDYPLTGRKIEVHNLLLARLAEIGLLGTIPLLVTVVLGIMVPCFLRAPPGLGAWRLALIMFAVAFAVMGMFGPMTAAFPNLLLWIFAGIAAAPLTTWPAAPQPRAPRPAVVTA